MDIPGAKNKMIDAAENKSAELADIKASPPTLNEYFFPGSGRWKPMTVQARTKEEADETHRSKREPVSTEGEKAEEQKETNNEQSS